MLPGPRAGDYVPRMGISRGANGNGIDVLATNAEQESLRGI